MVSYAVVLNDKEYINKYHISQTIENSGHLIGVINFASVKNGIDKNLDFNCAIKITVHKKNFYK